MFASAAEDDRAAAALSITRNWPEPVRTQPSALRVMGQAVGIERRDVAGGSADRDGVQVLFNSPIRVAGGGLERPGGEVEGGRSGSAFMPMALRKFVWNNPPLRLYVPGRSGQKSASG